MCQCGGARPDNPTSAQLSQPAAPADLSTPEEQARVIADMQQAMSNAGQGR